jgi:50S ribosomal protein L16 3-hydroxylase
LRGAASAFAGSLRRNELFELAAQEGVESRLLVAKGERWQLEHGPFKRLPPVKQGRWTLLVQGVEAHLAPARALMDGYRFLPEARLDDVMVSWAADGGGVGPHVDAYDVFLVQISGQRRWQISSQRDQELVDGLPLKILRDFRPEQEWLLEAGDILYLPPGWAHDGVAVGADCITASVGFRAASRFELADALLPRLIDPEEEDERSDLAPRYRDAGSLATATPAAIPEALADFARDALQRALDDPQALARCLGEWLSEPKRQLELAAQPTDLGAGVQLAPSSRMLYDRWHVFINGESFRAGGRDATLMRRLADDRALSAADCARLSAGARGLLQDWLEEGWVWPKR